MTKTCKHRSQKLGCDTRGEADARAEAKALAAIYDFLKDCEISHRQSLLRILERYLRRKSKRLLAVTGLGAGDSRGHGGFLYDALAFPLLLKRVYDDKDAQEQIIKSSVLDWTIVRPGLLTNRPATGRYLVLTTSKDWRFGVISRADVANFIIRQIHDRALIRATPLLIN